MGTIIGCTLTAALFGVGGFVVGFVIWHEARKDPQEN